jgi:hypothetical protein
MRQSRLGFILLAAALAFGHAAAGGASEEKPATAPASAPARGGAMAFKHVRIDLEARQVVLDATVCMQEGPLELLVCRAGTKEYESALATEAQGAHLHAAMLAMKLTPGLPAQWSGADDNARFLPPRGPELEIKLRWKDKNGNIQEADAGSWLKTSGRKAATPRKWVFVGSKILPNNRYWADVDGEIISVSNFQSAVIDVPFESTKDNTALEFAAKKEAIPPVGTPVEVVITPLPGAERSPYAQALLEVDRFGRMLIKGRFMSGNELTKWAEQYTSRHAKGFVFIRCDARALVDDVQNAITSLRRGGVRDFDIERLRPDGVILPRTPAQTNEELQTWAEKFKNPQEYVVDPAEEAQAVLQQIELELRLLDDTKDLLTRYRESLREYVEKTKPAVKPAGNP